MAGHRWFRLDTGYFQNPKIIGLGRPAILLHLALIAYCAEHLTDGYVTADAITSRSGIARIPLGSRSRARSELIAAGLLEANGEGWIVHDFLAMNPHLERAAIEAERQRWRDRKRDQRR